MIKNNCSERSPEIALWQNVIAKAITDAKFGRTNMEQAEAVWWIFFSQNYFNSFSELSRFCNVNPFKVKKEIAEYFRRKGIPACLRKYAPVIKKYWDGGGLYDSIW